MAKVLIPPALQKFTDGVPQVEILAEQIEDLIVLLEKEFPKLENKILNKKTILRFVKIFLNGTDISSLQGLQSKVSKTDKVKIVVALAGG